MNKSYQSVLQDLDRICGCANAAKETAKAINELIAQRDELVAAAIEYTSNAKPGETGNDYAARIDAAFNALRAAIAKVTGGAA